MDITQTIGLCKPATAILLVSVAGILYHMLAGTPSSVIWWILTGLFGTGVFQALCMGGLDGIAWVIMAIPILIVCFFFAVALFASRMRITNVERVPCDRCGRPKHSCGCGGSSLPPCGGCGRCPDCHKVYDATEGFTGDGKCGCEACGCLGGPCPVCRPGGCMNCGGAGCPYCAYASQVARGPFDISRPSALVE